MSPFSLFGNKICRETWAVTSRKGKVENDRIQKFNSQ